MWVVFFLVGEDGFCFEVLLFFAFFPPSPHCLGLMRGKGRVGKNNPFILNLELADFLAGNTSEQRDF